MGTKLYSGFQNIVFTTPWIMSQEASRFHFEHCVSLQDRSPLIFHYLYRYLMKSDSKITWLSFTTKCTSDDTFEVFEFVPKKFLFLLLFGTIRNKVQRHTYREILSLDIIFAVIIHIITRCFYADCTKKIT